MIARGGGGGGGGGGGYFRNFMTGCAGQTLKALPIHIKPKPENHTYPCNLAKNITFWYHLMGSRKEDSN